MSTKKVRFIEKTHQYLTADGNELISVSKFTDQFKEKLDWNAIAKKYAAKQTKEGNPMTVKDVLDKWGRKRDISAQVGTLYHSIRENELLSSEALFYNTKCDKIQCDFDSEFKYSIPIEELQNNTVYPELMIYDFDYMICGQSDKVIITNNSINIWDYKTDFEIKFRAFSSQWVKPQKMLPPLQHLDDCNGNHYSLKMSLYMYLLWKANKGRFRPGEIVIEHVHLKRDPENDNIPILEDGKPVVEGIEKIILPYRKKEVIAMLNTLK